MLNASARFVGSTVSAAVTTGPNTTLDTSLLDGKKSAGSREPAASHSSQGSSESPSKRAWLSNAAFCSSRKTPQASRTVTPKAQQSAAVCTV